MSTTIINPDVSIRLLGDFTLRLYIQPNGKTRGLVCYGHEWVVGLITAGPIPMSEAAIQSVEHCHERMAAFYRDAWSLEDAKASLKKVFGGGDNARNV